jgi:hypothetical protein
MLWIWICDYKVTAQGALKWRLQIIFFDLPMNKAE